jgi:DNA invertase Pin-like site-specific DNA recombinase
MPLAWSYQRTSTAKQAAADRSGMDRQEAALRQWLADHPDYQLAEALVDAGVSAGKGRHRTKGALARFIQGGRDGTIPPGSCLVVESLSRFSREVATSTLRTLLNDVWGQGLAVAFCAYGGEVLTEELIATESHRLHGLLGGIQQARAEYEERQRRSKGACVKRNQLQDEGITTRGRIPWWMVRLPDGTIALDPINTATVRRIVELATAGNGQNLIARTVQDEGRPNPKGKAAWTPEQARNTIDHPALSGDLVRRDRTLQGYYPAAISRVEHSALQQALAVNAEKFSSTGKRVHGKNLFQGVAFCHYCGGPIGRQRPNPNGRADHPGYARCSRAARGMKDANGEPCAGGSSSIYLDSWEAHCLTRLHRAVWAELLHRPDDAQRLQELRQQHSDLQQAADRDAAQLQRLEQRAEAQWADGADDELIATATRAVSRAREKAQQSAAAAAAAAQELATIEAMPQSDEQAAAMAERIAAFIRGLPDAGEAERISFNRWLCSRRPAVRFELDVHRQRVGLQVGSSAIDWQPLLPSLDLAGVRRGMTETVNVTADVDAETLELLGRLPRTEDGHLDLGASLNEVLGTDGQALVQG